MAQLYRIGECAVEPVARRQRRAIGCAVGSMVALRVRHRIGRHHHPLHLKQSGEFLAAGWGAGHGQDDGASRARAIEPEAMLLIKYGAGGLIR